MCACGRLLPRGSAAYEGKTHEALGVGSAAPGAHARPTREACHQGNDEDTCLAHSQLLGGGRGHTDQSWKPSCALGLRHNAGCTPAPPATKPSCETHAVSSWRVRAQAADKLRVESVQGVPPGCSRQGVAWEGHLCPQPPGGTSWGPGALTRGCSGPPLHGVETRLGLGPRSMS